MTDDLPYWNSQRRELVNWFKDRAPSFVAGYLAAIRLLYMPSFPARVHLVCHVVRDIYRFLPAVLGGRVSPRPAEVFPGMVKQLVHLWEASLVSEGKRFERIGSHVAVHANVHNYVAKIVEKSKKMARDQSTIGKSLAVALFNSSDSRDDRFIAPWIIKSFDDEYDFFVTRAHLAQREEQMPTDDGLVAHFEAFERAFHSMVGSYFTGKEELDAILQDTNDAAD